MTLTTFPCSNLNRTPITQNFEIQYIDFAHDENCAIENLALGNICNFGFCIDGFWQSQKESEPAYKVTRDTMSILHVPGQRWKVLFPAGVRLSGLNISFAVENMAAMFGEELFGRFISRFCNKQDNSIILFDKMPTHISCLARIIFEKRKTEGIEALYRESKILELLHECLRLHVQPTDQSTMRLSAFDIEKLQYAGEIIVANVETPPSIAGLSLLCGFNEYKLKKAFKIYYGMTVYNYIKSVRLDTARRMIEEQGASVTEAASSVGYYSFGHFSRAFRERFGMLPKEAFKPFVESQLRRGARIS